MRISEQDSWPEDIPIIYGWHEFQEGQVLLGVTGEPGGSLALCFLGMSSKEGPYDALTELQQSFPKASFSADQALTGRVGKKIAMGGPAAEDINLLLTGTFFQRQVWRALLALKPGITVTYQEIARTIGRPSALRAVGRAVGANPISLLVPCHRVLPASGGLGNYRWGVSWKKRLLAAEGVLL